MQSAFDLKNIVSYCLFSDNFGYKHRSSFFQGGRGGGATKSKIDAWVIYLGPQANKKKRFYPIFKILIRGVGWGGLLLQSSTITN